MVCNTPTPPGGQGKVTWVWWTLQEDWFHLVGFIHDLGKVLAHPAFGAQPQWAVVGDTFPTGCAHDPRIVFPDLFAGTQLSLLALLLLTAPVLSHSPSQMYPPSLVADAWFYCMQKPSPFC
jgi:hypothetical protein